MLYKVFATYVILNFYYYLELQIEIFRFSKRNSDI
jgi:hypothetical protein